MKVKNIAKYIAIIMFSTLFLLIFSLWTSPLYKTWYGCDASFFTMVGRGILTGWVPYEDFFDLKGPYFFFIEAITQLIVKGKTGAFIFQIFTLSASIYLIIKTCRLFISEKKTFFVTTLFLFFHIATLWGGNTLEEYMLPLSLLCVYLTLRDIDKTEAIKSSSALITGVSFSIILFSKITVASPIIGLVLGIIIYDLKKKRYFELLVYLLYAFLGLLIGITPIFVYFYIKGSLSHMLYSVFIFAFKRSVDFGTKYSLSWELKISGCYFALLFALLQFAKGKKYLSNVSEKSKDSLDFILIVVTCISVITAIALHFGDPFIYYFTTVYPALVLCFIAIFKLYDPFTLFRSWRLDVPMVFFLITLCYFASHSASTLNTVIYDRDNGFHDDYYNGAIEMASLIPYYERKDVYSINMDMQWFEINNMLPCYPYTINLQFFIKLDPRIRDEIINKMMVDPPKWIVVGGDPRYYVPEIYDVLVDKYTPVYKNDFGELYLLK